MLAIRGRAEQFPKQAERVGQRGRGFVAVARPRQVHPAALAGWLLLLASLCGCRSPYYADRGAAVGGLTGAGVGAAVGHATGHTGAGAAIGTAVGALTGAVVGQGLDDVRAENQAAWDQYRAEQQARQTTPEEIISMTRAGLSDDVIAAHVRANGLAQPLSPNQLIWLKQNGVSDGVMRVMQEPGLAQVQAVGSLPAPVSGPVIVEQHYIERPVPVWGPPPHPRWCGPYPRGRSGVSWGVSVSR